MNYPRLVLTAVVATLVDMVYGFAVYGTALAREVSPYGGVYRPIAAVNANLPWLVVGLLLTMLTATYLFAKMYDGGSRTWAGLRFGVVVGLFVVGYVAIGNYVVTNIGRRLAVLMAAACLLEWIVVGLAIGAVYRSGDQRLRSR